jgi:hypothetical protein
MCQRRGAMNQAEVRTHKFVRRDNIVLRCFKVGICLFRQFLLLGLDAPNETLNSFYKFGYLLDRESNLLSFRSPPVSMNERLAGGKRGSPATSICP